MSYTIEFTNINDPYARYAVVCCNKQWGQPGCQPWTGDCAQTIAPAIGQTVTIQCCSGAGTITAVTSSDSGYYYSVTIKDPSGKVIAQCPKVDRNNPCVATISAPASTPAPTSAPIPIPTSIPSISKLSPMLLLLALMALLGIGVIVAIRRR